MWVNIMLGERSIIRTRNGALLIGSVPRDFYGMKRNNEEEFHLANGTTLNRVEIGEPSRSFVHA